MKGDAHFADCMQTIHQTVLRLVSLTGRNPVWVHDGPWWMHANDSGLGKQWAVYLNPKPLVVPFKGIQLQPMAITITLEKVVVCVMGSDGSGVWNNVHPEATVDRFMALLAEALRMSSQSLAVGGDDKMKDWLKET